ncbi:TM2 domain-containing protein 3 [Octopus sinensis]|uniref:TM2 domain-containing protein 3 n=1 Tax=Octopus sinensis TaxID=2607531 RepID=A0A6P7T888_9MOLL|nr:TM2 domain-containing protein 3 [Octopus sinensis]
MRLRMSTDRIYRLNWSRISLLLPFFSFLFILTRGDSSSSSVEVPSSSRDGLSTPGTQSTSSTNSSKGQTDNGVTESYIHQCPSLTMCQDLGPDCITCNFSSSCIYGQIHTVTCKAKQFINCTGPEKFERQLECRFCYQLDPSNYTCNSSTSCRVVAAPRQKYVSTCKVKEPVMCLGNRSFYKYRLCNWTSGYRWSVALLLSITLGGFGVDRFYLGLWEEGIGKLFSFGGLGVWTIIDVILIAIGYIGPADGSLYIY